MVAKKTAKLKQYFWDVQWKVFNPRSYPDFTIERLLEYGDNGAMLWLNRNFSRKAIIKALKRSRMLSKKSANYWSLLYNIKSSEIRCLNRPSQSKQSRVWKS